MLTFQMAKNCNSPKGLTHDFGQKNFKTFLFAFSQNILKNRVSLCSKQKKNHFLTLTIVGSFHNVKNRNFQKVLAHDFQNFSLFIF